MLDKWSYMVGYFMGMLSSTTPNPMIAGMIFRKIMTEFKMTMPTETEFREITNMMEFIGKLSTGERRQ